MDKNLRYQYLMREKAASDKVTIQNYYTRKGIEEDEQKGEQRVNHLIQLLLQNSRSDDITRMVNDQEFQKKLFDEFGI